MQRRSLLAGGVTAATIALAGCLDVASVGGDPDGGESFYETGTIEVLVDGEPVDLTAERFQAEFADEDVRFHLHDGDDQWHMERERVTFATGIDVLPLFGYDEVDGAHVVTVDDTTYDAREDGVEVAFAVNGEAVDPTTHELQQDDHLTLEVTTDETDG